jgi:hypothetical protein
MQFKAPTPNQIWSAKKAALGPLSHGFFGPAHN